MEGYFISSAVWWWNIRIGKCRSSEKPACLQAQYQISPFQAFGHTCDKEYFQCLFQGFIPSMINVLELSVTNYAT